MFRFSLHILIFLLLAAAAVFLIPVNKELAYRGLKNDCFNHASWMYDRLYQNPLPVDIAFVGSSHTINAIDDQLLEEKLGKRVLNFGYCRHGRNLDYVLAEDLIGEKKPELLVVEVRSTESSQSHPVFPYLADNRNLITAYPWFNAGWFSDFSLALRYRVQLLQESLWTDSQPRQPDGNTFGFTPIPDTAFQNQLQMMKGRRQMKKPSPEWKQDFDHKFALHYVKSIAELCAENDVQLVFLYLPAYGMPYQEPVKAAALNAYAPILLPPSEILENPNYWHDENHLNRAGAAIFSKWLARELSERNF